MVKTLSAAPEIPELMTAKEAADHMRIPLATVYYLAQEGKIPSIRIGGRLRFKKAMIDSQILQNEEPEAHVPYVRLQIAEGAMHTLVRKQLGTEGMGVMLNPPAAETDTIITDGSGPIDDTFRGQTISILPDTNPDTIALHVREGQPVTLTTIQHVSHPETLRKLLGLVSPN